MSLDYAIWCLECNHAAPQPKVILDPKQGRVIYHPPRLPDDRPTSI